MQQFPVTPRQTVISLRRNRHLIWQLAKREVAGRYKGSVFGLLWSFFNPLLMLAVYTFFFSVVFNSRWTPDSSEGKGDFAIALFVGLIIHTFIAECASKGPTLITSNPSYVKKIIFPLEIFPVVSALSALFHVMVSLVVLAAFMLILSGGIPITFLLFPLILIPLAIVGCAVGWLLAGLGVYIRDVSQTVGIIVMIMMYTSPVFFPLTMMPEKYRDLLYLNPMTLLMVQARKFMLWGQQPNYLLLAAYTVAALIAAWLCFAWFQKVRRGFADVL